MILRTMILKKMKLNHNWNITMVTTEILEISLTNIVSFIQLTTTLYSTNNQFLFYSLKYLWNIYMYQADYKTNIYQTFCSHWTYYLVRGKKTPSQHTNIGGMLVIINAKKNKDEKIEYEWVEVMAGGCLRQLS